MLQIKIVNYKIMDSISTERQSIALEKKLEQIEHSVPKDFE